MKSRNLIFFLTVLLIALFSGCSQKEDSIVNPDSLNRLDKKPVAEKAKLVYFQLVVNDIEYYDIGQEQLP